MCGFAGEFLCCPDGRADVQRVRRLALRLRHRGPDEAASYLCPDGRCAIGFHRLAVIDLPGSHQPMTSPDGAVTVAFNGEIYNFRQLRRRLKADGAAFRTAGDTEVNPDLATGGSFWATSVFGTLSMAITDQDDDGLNDMAELLLGTDGSSAWTLADGYSDSDKAALGLAPSDAISLAVTDLGVNVAGAALKWRLAVTLDPLVNRVLLSNLTGVTSDGTVGYVVEYKPTLDAPGWTAVQTGRVTISGERTVNGLIDRSAIDLSKGFFRVRLTK